MLPGRHLGDLFAATIIITIFFTTATSQPSQPPHRSQLYRLTCVHASGEREATGQPSIGLPTVTMRFSSLFSSPLFVVSSLLSLIFIFYSLLSSLLCA